MRKNSKYKYGLIKSSLDAHTLGINTAASLLAECDCEVILATGNIPEAFDKIELESNQEIILKWIKEKEISHIGLTYRLDPGNAILLVSKFMYMLKKNMYMDYQGGAVKKVFFAGLPEACEQIKTIFKGEVVTFKGGEHPIDTLLRMGVPKENISTNIQAGCKYDDELLSFGKSVIDSGCYEFYQANKNFSYSKYGTKNDTVEERLKHKFSYSGVPLIRAHSGPYHSDKTRIESIKEFLNWCVLLSKAGLLDILSIGTSQLSQSNFGEDWSGLTNGGGVPINSENEFYDIWLASRPLLLRTYSGTKNIKRMAKIYEESINICWHALSFWWFNSLDGRGPNMLYDNLVEHIDTIKYIAKTNKPMEANVSHHFSFRGGDDVTYILSAYLAAKTAKMQGVKTYILQNMLNTPRSTWGIQDLAKSRALLKLLKSLEDDNFRIILQTRAGLDYFKPDAYEAKVQLAAVTALMDDIDPLNTYSPEIIHVVSYSEAMHLATPAVINESIKITQQALLEYRKKKRKRETYDVLKNSDIENRTNKLMINAHKVINVLEQVIPNLYTPEGLYLCFVSGWLPVPDLWTNSDEFKYAKSWKTKLIDGGVKVVDEKGIVSVDSFINTNICRIDDAKYFLKTIYGIKDM